MILLPNTFSHVVVPTIVEPLNNLQQRVNDQTPINESIINEPTMNELHEIALRMSERQKRLVISDDYVVYLQ